MTPASPTVQQGGPISFWHTKKLRRQYATLSPEKHICKAAIGNFLSIFDFLFIFVYHINLQMENHRLNSKQVTWQTNNHCCKEA